LIYDSDFGRLVPVISVQTVPFFAAVGYRMTLQFVPIFRFGLFHFKRFKVARPTLNILKTKEIIDKYYLLNEYILKSIFIFGATNKQF
jgi:hypothetical protein